MRSVIGAARLLLFVLSGFFTIAYQSTLMLFTKGPVAFIYPRLFHSFICRMFGVRIITEGKIEQGRNVIYAGNHISYLDIEVIGALLRGSFVAKKEVESWPLLGTMGSMQRTIYISRAPQDAQSEIGAMMQRLEEGIPLIVFPEGTSSDGKRVLPFKSSFFQMFLGRDFRIQPFTISVLEVDGKSAASDAVRDAYAWYGDMTLEPHLWNFAKGKGAVVKVVFHEPVHALPYSDRKQLCAAVEARVAEGLDLPALAA
jgi:1-acyl-sn-glycerol-3-phosphate acyltransferase